MKYALIQILCLCAVCLNVGCQQTKPKRQEASIEGIKLTDLLPPEHEFKLKQIQLDLIAFEMPAENFAVIESVIKTLSDSSIAFTSKDYFKANGFRAGLGNNEQWRELIPSLREARARKAFTSKIMIFDQQGDDVYLKNINTPLDISYLTRHGETKENTLQAGRAFFRIKAMPIVQRKGLAAVKVQALYKDNFGKTLPLPTGATIRNETLFDFTSLRLEMNEGEFLIIAPDKYTDDYSSINGLFFSFVGDYPEPVENPESIIHGPGFKIKHGVPLVRIYMLACIKVDN